MFRSGSQNGAGTTEPQSEWPQFRKTFREAYVSISAMLSLIHFHSDWHKGQHSFFNYKWEVAWFVFWMSV